jgi:hypothetical protein
MGLLLEAFKDMGVVMSKDKETNAEGGLDMDLGEYTGVQERRGVKRAIYSVCVIGGGGGGGR